jgi:hypothetical protein
LKTEGGGRGFQYGVAWRDADVDGDAGPDRGGGDGLAPGRLAGFRQEVYRCLGRRRDALFELGDAVLCRPGRVHMLAELSLEPECRRACRTVPSHLQETSSRIHTRNRRAGADSEKGGVAGTAPKVKYSLAGPERSPLDDYRSSRRQLCGGRFVAPSAPVDGGRWLSTPGHGCSLSQCSPL